MKTCPICHRQGRLCFLAHSIGIFDCTNCDHRYASVELSPTHVSEIYDDTYFFAGGAGYNDYLSEAALLIASGRRYARLMSRWCRPGQMLDVGAAAGFILKGFAQEGWHGSGIEPNSHMATIAQEQNGVNVIPMAFEKLQIDERFDLITMIQVIAHFTDPQQALVKAQKLLKPGGYLLVETWKRDSLTARLLGPRWHEYSPPSVLHWFTSQSLSRLGRECGLSPLHRGTPLKWIGAGHALGLLSYKLGDSLASKLGRAAIALVPSNLAIPYLSEDLVWMVFRNG